MRFPRDLYYQFLASILSPPQKRLVLCWGSEKHHSLPLSKETCFSFAVEANVLLAVLQNKVHVGNEVKSLINIQKCVLSAIFIYLFLFIFTDNGIISLFLILTRHLCFPFPVSDSTDCVGGGSGFRHLLAATSCDSSLGWIRSFPTDSSLISLQDSCTLPGLQQFFCKPNYICISLWKF